VTTLHHSAQAVGLSYPGSCIIHSRIANADILAFRAKNHPITLMFPLQTIKEKGAANP
jgi:hypothetical protein